MNLRLRERRLGPARVEPARVATPGIAVGFGLGFVLLVGGSIRVVELLSRPSLSLDESFLALNVIGRTWIGLSHTLDFNQGAPLGFLWLEKAVITIFGPGETAFRLIPFASGVGALVAFVPLARKALAEGTGQLVALSLMASSSGAVIYATSAKQYSTDLLAAVLVYLVALRLHEPHVSRAVWLTAIAGGGLVLWFSHASVFVLAGVISVLLVDALRKRETSRAARLAVMGIGWGVSFVIVYLINITRLSELRGTLRGEPGSLVDEPLGRNGVEPVQEAARAYARSIRDIFGIAQAPLAGIDVGDFLFVAAAAGILAGLVLLVRRAPFTGLVLLSPLPFLVLAAVLGRYPVFPRTVLFTLPALSIFAGEALARVVARIAGDSRRRVVTLAIVLSIVGLSIVGDLPSRFRDEQHPRRVLSLLASIQRPSESLYVFFASQYRLAYYMSCECFATERVMERARILWPIRAGVAGAEQWAPALASKLPDLVIGNHIGPDSQQHAREFDRLRGKGDVWILMSDLSAEEVRIYLSTLRGLGREKSTIGEQKPGTMFATLFHFPEEDVR